MVIPIAFENNKIILAVDEPRVDTCITIIEDLKILLDSDVKLVIAKEGQVILAIIKYYGQQIE